MKIVSKENPDTISDPKTETDSQEEEIIVCAQCNWKITDPDQQIMVDNSFSHVFANPYGLVFEIGCFSKAPGCIIASVPSDEFSWFPGYAWQIGICQNCSAHLGWVFTASSDRFYGLILEKIVFP